MTKLNRPVDVLAAAIYEMLGIDPPPHVRELRLTLNWENALPVLEIQQVLLDDEATRLAVKMRDGHLPEVVSRFAEAPAQMTYVVNEHAAIGDYSRSRRLEFPSYDQMLDYLKRSTSDEFQPTEFAGEHAAKADAAINERPDA